MDESTRSKEVNWSVIPFARASHTVKRHCELEPADETNTLNDLPLETRSQSIDGIQLEDTRMHPFGVHGKVVRRLDSGTSSSKKLQIITCKENLPHPSKLKKRKTRTCNSLKGTAHRQKHGVDVVAHMAQLKRKQAEFKWLSPFASHFEEQLFPLSRGACRELQKVPSSPDMRHCINTEAHSKCYTDTLDGTSESSLKEFHGEGNDLLHDFQPPRSLWQASQSIGNDIHGHYKGGNEDFQLISFFVFYLALSDNTILCLYDYI